MKQLYCKLDPALGLYMVSDQKKDDSWIVLEGISLMDSICNMLYNQMHYEVQMSIPTNYGRDRTYIATSDKETIYIDVKRVPHE